MYKFFTVMFKDVIKLISITSGVRKQTKTMWILTKKEMLSNLKYCVLEKRITSVTPYRFSLLEMRHCFGIIYFLALIPRGSILAPYRF